MDLYAPIFPYEVIGVIVQIVFMIICSISFYIPLQLPTICSVRMHTSLFDIR